MNHEKAVFLDRDGVINKKPPEHDYVKNLQEFHLLPDVQAGLKFIKNKEYLAVIISNQRGIARGMVTTEVIEKIHNQLNEFLKQDGTSIDAFYWCGHDYKDKCTCRKPAPGLILKASRELHVDLRKSWFIGDSKQDQECAANAGVRFKMMSTDGSLLEAVKEMLNE